MKVSVIIPTYCPGNYIWQCLQSLETQTLPQSEFETLIMLNGPKEPYHQMLQDGLLQKTNLQNISLLFVEKPGVSNARNMALEIACGDNICFIDDDDWVSPDYLKELLMNVAQNMIPIANVMDFHEVTGNFSAGYINRAYLRLRDKGPLSLMQGRSFMSSSCCKMISRKSIGDKRFDPRFRLGEDALFMASISVNIQRIMPVRDSAVYYRRIRSESASHKRISFLHKTRLSLRLTLCYTYLYFRDIRNHNFIFFLSRIFASLSKIFKKQWI